MALRAACPLDTVDLSGLPIGLKWYFVPQGQAAKRAVLAPAERRAARFAHPSLMRSFRSQGRELSLMRRVSLRDTVGFSC